MRRLAASIVALNVVDAISTQLAIAKGLATELNPLMGWAIAHGFLLFWGLKFGVLLLGLWMLWRVREHAAQVVNAVMIGGTILYALLALYQVLFWVVYFVQ